MPFGKDTRTLVTFALLTLFDFISSAKIARVTKIYIFLILIAVRLRLYLNKF